MEETTPTTDAPVAFFNDDFVTKSRGNNYRSPKKVQVKTILFDKIPKKTRKPVEEEKFTPLVPTTVIRKPTPCNLVLRNEGGYALNRTQSTGGIAAKVSLELKKKYLLGGDSTVPGNIQKSGSVSTLDSKFKSFHSNITDCQKLLKPAPEISASMKTFCNKLDERTSPLSPTLLSQSPTFFSSVIEKSNTETKIVSDEKQIEVFENENEGRPRSPVHETSIVVPEINWEKKDNKKLDSLNDLTSSTESLLSNDEKKTKIINVFANIPRLEIHDDAGVVLNANDEEIPYDSLNMELSQNSSMDAPKSITSEKKKMNEPKPLPESDPILTQVHETSHGKVKDQNRNSSGRSTPDSCADQATGAALTETELSDWARDEAVSEDYEDVVFNSKTHKDIKNECVNIAKIAEFEELSNIYPKEKFQNENRNTEILECVNSILNPSNLDNIEFMDNGTETSSEDDNGNNGYMQLQNEDDDGLLDSLNPVCETKNPLISTPNQACVFNTNENAFHGAVLDLKPSDVQKLAEKHKTIENEEDSLFVIETGTTTEENTCSDSTVKNVTEKLPKISNTNILSALPEAQIQEANEPTQNPNEYEEHCQRLASKVEFGNVKDSIDVRKSKRKSKTEIPDLIQEEKEHMTISKLYRKEEIEKERDKNQKLIQEMVMNKMKAQNKSLERKKRNKTSFSPIRPHDLAKSATTDLTVEIRNNYNETHNKKVLINKPPPDLIKTIPIQKSQTVSDFKTTPVLTRPLSVHIPKTNFDHVHKTTNTSETASLPNINQTMSKEELIYPKPFPRQKNHFPTDNIKEEPSNDDQQNNKLKHHKRKKSKENVFVDDSIESLVLNTERRNSLLYSNDTLTKKRNNSFRRCKSGEDQRKSVPDFDCLKYANSSKTTSKGIQLFHKSDPNLLNGVDSDNKKEKRKLKDHEGRKSISKFIADIFTKKKDGNSPNSPTKGFFSMITPKNKEKSKVNFRFDFFFL